MIDLHDTLLMDNTVKTLQKLSNIFKNELRWEMPDVWGGSRPSLPLDPGWAVRFHFPNRSLQGPGVQATSFHFTVLIQSFKKDFKKERMTGKISFVYASWQQIVLVIFVSTLPESRWRIEGIPRNCWVSEMLIVILPR